MSPLVRKVNRRMSRSSYDYKEESNKQLVPCSPSPTPPIQLNARPNLVPFRPIKLYVPDDDESVPQVFALGRHIFKDAQCYEEDLLSGYFSALCAVLPDAVDIAKKILEHLCYRVTEVKIPSQAALNFISIPASSSLRLETINFALLCILPFEDKPEEMGDDIVHMVTKNLNFNFSEHRLCQGSDMRTLSSALSFSGLCPILQSFIASSVKALATTSTPLGCVLSQVKHLI